MSNENTLAAPVASSERIISLDILRGFAVLGILFMNIQSYSMISASYINPTAFGDLTGLNRWIWTLSHIFTDQKFMTIFSMLFGAGVILFTQRMEVKGRNAAGLHYRRTFWLLIIGLVHAYIFWYGDILVIYACCAVFIFLFRKISAKKLFIIGLIFVSVSTWIYLLMGFSIQFWPPEAIENTMKSWLPDSAAIAKEIVAYQRSWVDQMKYRVPSAISSQTFLFLIWSGWRAGGLMLIGMALFKWGVFSSEKSKIFYIKLIVTGIIVGLPIVGYGIIQNFSANWAMEFSMFFGSQFNYWGSIFVAFFYIGLVMLIVKMQIWRKLTSLLAAVGRMALTNYLLQTLICTALFYGHGFGLFGEVNRVFQILIVFIILFLQMLISPIWLRYFNFGPVEWLWRSLTYWKIQPFRSK